LQPLKIGREPICGCNDAPAGHEALSAIGTAEAIST
jgi:hypothetical protein